LAQRQFPELDHDVRWEELAKTAGFGTIHLGGLSTSLLRELSEKRFGGRRVNHRFGEGSSPRLRQVREGLDALGIRSDAVLNHATPRLFYGCKLVEDASEQLLGLSKQNRSTSNSLADISEVWRQRWLSGRAQRDEILDRVSMQNGRTFVSEMQAASEGDYTAPAEE
jgi:hypothetical protein